MVFGLTVMSALNPPPQTSSACEPDKSDPRFMQLGRARHIWVVGAIHAEAEKLMQIHDQLYDRLGPGDRVIYSGNLIGVGPDPVGTLDELLTFRRGALALPGMMADDFVYLRGGQEEMWEKVQQLQFARNPKDVLNWMLENGLASTLEGYGLHARSGLFAACEGVMALTKWTASIRTAIRMHPGHDIFQCQLRRAAYTDIRLTHPLLFVHAGLSPMHHLQEQGDALWWGGQNFHDDMAPAPYAPFRKVIRGYDPHHRGVQIQDHAITIDGGCGHGGPLICAGFDQNGEMIGVIESA
jgi:serine/threonine protein phosphatase 1